MKTLRSAKKGSAGGLSEYHSGASEAALEKWGLHPELLGEVATQFARGQVLEEV